VVQMAIQLKAARPSNLSLLTLLPFGPNLLKIGTTQLGCRRSTITAVALGFSSLLFTISGCRKTPRQPAAVAILDPEWSQPDELPRAERESQEFTRETGIPLKHLPVPETSLGQLDLVRGLLQEGGSSPDVVGIDVIWPGILADYLIDLRPQFTAELSSEDPQLVASYTVDGKLVALPYHTHVGVLQYRTDLLREYGYTHPPKTWDELERMAARIQAGERAKGKKDFWGYIWQGAAAEGLTCNALEWQVAEGGGRIIESDKTISVNNPAAIRAWQRAARWVGWISPPGVVAYRELDSMNVWDSGEAAFRRTWQWDYRLAHWQDSAMPDKTGYSSMPGGPGGRVGTLGGIGLGVSRVSAHPQEAVALVRFLVDRELQSKVAHQNAKVPSQPEMYGLPLVVDPYTRSAQTDQPRGSLVSRPSNVTGRLYETVTKAYLEAVHSVLAREKTAPKAAADLEKQLIAITGFKTGPPKGGD
jgi:trehalose/maltose transport system substrate-binding protein